MEKKCRFLVVEYCFEDDSFSGVKNILGSYETISEARNAAGWYIKRNVKKKRAKYRDWVVRVQADRIYFPIDDLKKASKSEKVES